MDGALDGRHDDVHPEGRTCSIGADGTVSGKLAEAEDELSEKVAEAKEAISEQVDDAKIDDVAGSIKDETPDAVDSVVDKIADKAKDIF